MAVKETCQEHVKRTHKANLLLEVDVDKTNQGYYGETNLNYLTTDGIHDGLVPLRKEGHVHDVRW